ncbi:DUF2140 family protein [Rossellomorea vietnamensis]|uniref:DUF2140 family protein n=1 Tax=Rossellomorea vietnamensis TaxID=218284 RepID=A0A5D4MKW5_9BACI|nr:YpmS family protein [Rossellomorea vietnamensis]TYS01631.1 DUF2140 family protein [Rossellomorea vietnamensis]
MKKKWKASFFTLLGFNILVILFVAVLLMVPIEDDELPEESLNERENVAFQIRATKKDLNQIIDHYIEDEFTAPVDYSVVLDDQVVLNGAVPVFTSEINFKMTFEPKALENGDLLLKQDSISVGALNLPVEHVLKIIRDSYEFPEWIKIQPNEELIYVSLQNLEMKSDLKVRAEKFDLENDNIVFNMLVPVD